MKTTPTGQRASPNHEPSTNAKHLDAASASPLPNVPSGKEGKPPKGPAGAAVGGTQVSISPAPTQAGRAKSPGTGSRPSTAGRGGKSRRAKNPLEEPPEEDLPPPPPPPTDAAQDEAALVGDAAPGADGGAAAAADGGDTTKPQQQATAQDDTADDAAAGEPWQRRGGAWRALRTNAVLVGLAALVLATTIVLCALQGGFIDARDGKSDSAARVDESCVYHATDLVRALTAEAHAAEELRVFHRTQGATIVDVNSPANVSAAAYRDARAAYTRTVIDTDEALKVFFEFWTNDVSAESRTAQELVGADKVAAFNDAVNPTTGGPKPWAKRRGYATTFATRVDGSAAPSLSPVRSVDVHSLDLAREWVYAGKTPFATVPAYGAVSRSVSSLCGTSLQLLFSPRLGDPSFLAAAGANAAGLGAVGLQSAAGASTLPRAALVDYSGVRQIQLYEAAGTRAAVRAWPITVPELATESAGAQAVVPQVTISASAASSAALAAQLDGLSPAAVATLRRNQRSMAGRAAAFVEASKTAAVRVSAYERQAAASRAMLWTALAAAAVGCIAAVAFAFADLSRRDKYDALDREIVAVSHSVERMRVLISKVRSLKLGSVAALRRRVRLPRAEETALYGALANLRETELFLPSTVARPPIDMPAACFSGDHLCVRPKLVERRHLIAIRVDLSQHHRKFSDVDAKKQAVHHHLVRFLATIDEAVTSMVPHAYVHHYGAYSNVILDLCGPLEFPATTALAVADEIANRSKEIFNMTPTMALAQGTAVVGNVGSIISAPNADAVAALESDERDANRGGADHQQQRQRGGGAAPLTSSSATAIAAGGDGTSAAMAASRRAFKAFTSFGQVNEDCLMLSAVSKLHAAGIVCSSEVAMRASQELAAFKEARSHARGREVAGSDVVQRCAEHLRFRALELVTRVAHEPQVPVAVSDGDSTAPRHSTGEPSLSFASQGNEYGGRAVRATVPFARVLFEVVRHGSDRPTDLKTNAWNRVLRNYTLGHLTQARSALESYRSQYGEGDSVKRISNLIAVAEHVHGTGDERRPSSPFVATYAEVMRDALVECA